MEQRRAQMKLGLAMVVTCLTLGATLDNSSMAQSEGIPARCRVKQLVWTEPKVVGAGFEPSVEVDSNGTVLVTAAGASIDGIPALSSGLWRSRDNGETFQAMRGARSGFPGLEGDIAVDGHDRLYFADTFFFDSYFERYSADGQKDHLGQPTIATSGLDDRPWLAAHGDGFVYYMANSGVGPGGRQQVIRSTDGGQTFEQPGLFIKNSGEGSIAADPNSSYVYVATNHLWRADKLPNDDKPTAVEVSISPDRGATWSQTTAHEYTVARDESPQFAGFSPIPAVSPFDGSVHIVWTDGPQRLMLTQSFDRGKSWRTIEVTPFEGRFGMPWIDVASDGTVGLSFVAGANADPAARYAVYAMTLSPKRTKQHKGCPPQVKAIGEIPGTAHLDDLFQRDFFQLAFGPDDALHVVFRPAELEGEEVTDGVVSHSQARQP